MIQTSSDPNTSERAAERGVSSRQPNGLTRTDKCDKPAVKLNSEVKVEALL